MVHSTNLSHRRAILEAFSRLFRRGAALLITAAILSDIAEAASTSTIEAESMRVPSFSGPGYHIVIDADFSDEAGVVLDSTAVGQYIKFLIPNISAGTYNVRIGVKRFNTRGVVQLAIGQAGNNNPMNVGAPQDLYSASPEFVELDFGTWKPTTRTNKWFWFTVTGKNSSSSGYTVAIDYILLLPQ
jgi:hypothetical protein